MTGSKDEWSRGGNSSIALIASTRTTTDHYRRLNLWKQAGFRPTLTRFSMSSWTQSFCPREIIHRNVRCQINPIPPNAP